MVKLKSLTKLYGNFTAVNNLNLEVMDGEILGIIGPNGAGKTTTLKMIMGLLSPTSGFVEIMGKDMAKESTYIKRYIGYLPEESPLYENMTVSQYLMFFSELYRIPKIHASNRLETLLTSLKLAEKNQLNGELSKGMKRKVAIARTLLHEPSLLILDEPNSGLDPITSFFIIDYLKTLNKQGTTIVLSAHNLFHVEYICDRVGIMKNGDMIICDTMESIRNSLGQTEYKIVFKANANLGYEKWENQYIFRATDVNELAKVLKEISDNDWALIDLSVQQSALEDMYLKLMSDSV